jgi:Endomembrane protein 70
MKSDVGLGVQVGPYTNPSETYRYYSLPYCPPVNMKGQSQELGDVLSGDRRVNTPYNLRFKGRVGAWRDSLLWLPTNVMF